MSNIIKNKVRTQDWFYHPPNQFNRSQVQLVPAMSQVPGLTPITTKTSDENQYKQKWIRDTDSDYIKMAKAGGRKDLFRYRDHKPLHDPVPYPRVNWFDDKDDPDDDNENNNMDTSTGSVGVFPEWFQHEEHRKSDQQSFDIYERPLLGFDALVAWERDDFKLPEINQQNKSRKSKSMQETKKDTRFPLIRQRKKSIDNGDMVGLLSYQYQKDFINETQTKSDERKKQQYEEKKLAKEKLTKDRELFQKKKKKPTPSLQKPMFKLSKFESVSSRTVSRR